MAYSVISSAVPLWDFKNLSVFEKSVTLLRKEPTTTLNPACSCWNTSSLGSSFAILPRQSFV
ncbi:hypothetical protein ALC60_09673 [Trachymyrmex zeteki]|uniref:Uncharacterized protein n=1 Tax=Mycetomoellerius zeteki TaxID=64791 RepID=A0A151WTP8_9HYME|nr:hypothetical protein ALC60_09673 [Trachymyrmex zeteki]